MHLHFAMSGYPSTNLYSPLVMVVTMVSVVVCFVAALPKVRNNAIGGVFILIAAPIPFVTVFFFLSSEYRAFQLSTGCRGYQDLSDYLAVGIALGASYLIAREATRVPTRSMQTAGWIEAVAIAIFAGLFLFAHLIKVVIS